MSRADNARSHRRFVATHRYLGLAASLIVVGLVVTGVLLNHAERLELHERPVRSERVLDWYGMSPESDPMSYRLETGWIVGLEGDIYWNAEPVAASDSPLIGAVARPDILVVASRDAIVLLASDRRAAVIDRLDSASLPGALERIGVGTAGGLVVQVESGAIFRVDDDLLDWQRIGVGDETAAIWSESSPLPPLQRKAVLASYRGEGLTWFRMIIDIHTGRFLGGLGPWLIDGAALILLLLTGSGIYNWLQVRRSNGAIARQPVKEPAPAPQSVYDQ
jgi:hypothetical protein